MNPRSGTDFNIIAEALVLYREQNNSLFAEQMISEKLGLQPEIIRAKIKAWTNITPERLVMYLEPSRIKRVISQTCREIKNNRANYPDVRIEAMKDNEAENGGINLSINYQFADTPFGPVIIASTRKGVCYLAFSDEGNEEALSKLKARFPKAAYKEKEDLFQRNALSLFSHKVKNKLPVQLHLKGTSFQIETWNKLLKIPPGGLMSYSSLTDDPKNSHALGAAVGSNPIAYIIPCHRTVRASGEYGEYHWGSDRKAALICLEAVQANNPDT